MTLFGLLLPVIVKEGAQGPDEYVKVAGEPE
jgi:hypothetical protein